MARTLTISTHALRSLRDQKFMTQQQMADAAGLHLRSYQRFEEGDNCQIFASSLRQLAKALCMPAEQLFEQIHQADPEEGPTGHQ